MSTSHCLHRGERCWPCMTGMCHDRPTEHVWWDTEDVEHAQATHQAPPRGMCGCAFCGWPALGRRGPLDTEAGRDG